MDFCLQGLVAICESVQHGSVGIAPVTSDVCMTGLALLWDALLFSAMIRGFLGSWIGRNHPQTMRYSVFVWNHCIYTVGRVKAHKLTLVTCAG